MSLWAKISRVLEFGPCAGIHCPVDFTTSPKEAPLLPWRSGTEIWCSPQWPSQDGAVYLRAVSVPQHSLQELMESGTCPTFPQMREFSWFLETLFPLHQILSGLLMLCWNKLLLNYGLLHWPQLCPEYQQLLLWLSAQTEEILFSPHCALTEKAGLSYTPLTFCWVRWDLPTTAENGGEKGLQMVPCSLFYNQSLFWDRKKNWEVVKSTGQWT